MRKIATWLLAASLALPLAGCGLLGSPEKQRAGAEEALARGDYGEATITLRNLLEDDAENIELRLLLARALHMQGDPDGAQRTLQAAIDRGASRPDTAVLRAEWALDNGDFQALLESMDDDETALSADQRTYYRARALLGLRRVPEAIFLFRELAAARPQSADLQLRIAQSHASLGRIEQAEVALEAALERPVTEGEAPITAEAWILKGTLAEHAGNMELVTESYQRASQAAPGELPAPQFGQLLSGAIDHALRAGDLEAARGYRAQMASVLPQSPLARMMGAQVQLHEQAASADAIAELQRLLQENSGNRPARLLLAAAQLHSGALEQALAEVNALASSAPESAEIKGVQDLVRSASSQSPDSAERSMSIAAALVALRQPALGRSVLDQAVAKAPDDRNLQRARVQLELRSGRPDKAVPLARALVEENPDLPVATALLAEAQAANRDFAAAAQTYQRVWESSPSAPLALAYSQARHRAGIPEPELPLRQWLERHPRDPAIRLTLASALQQAGSAADAIREFQRAMAELPPGHPMRGIAQNNLAMLYAQLGDSRALETARSAYQAAGNLPAVQDTYGWLLVQGGKAAEALPLLRSASEASPDSDEIRYHYAQALAATGDKVGAGILLADLLQSGVQFEGRSEARRLHDSL